MPVSATTLAILMRAGLTGDALLEAVAAIDADMAAAGQLQASAPETAADRRRAWDRDRKRQQAAGTWKSGGNRVEIPHGNPPEDSKKEKSPTPPKEKTTPLSQEPSVPSSSPADPVEKPNGEAKPKRATRLPAEWRPSEKNRSDALRLGVPGPSVDRLAERFRDYWTAKAGKDGAKLDWDATFRNWCSNECERRGWAPMLADGDGPSTGDTTASGRFYAMQDTPEFDAWAQHTRKRMADAKGGWWFESRWPPGWKRETPEREAPASGVFAFDEDSS